MVGKKSRVALVIQQTNAVVGEETKIAPPLSERGCDA
jgi:hypothetical protein